MKAKNKLKEKTPQVLPAIFAVFLLICSLAVFFYLNQIVFVTNKVYFHVLEVCRIFYMATAAHTFTPYHEHNMLDWISKNCYGRRDFEKVCIHIHLVKYTLLEHTLHLVIFDTVYLLHVRNKVHRCTVR